MFKVIIIMIVAGMLSCGNKADQLDTKAIETVDLSNQKETPKAKVDKKKSVTNKWKEYKKGEIAIDVPVDWLINDSGKSKTTFIVFPDRIEGEAKFTDNINLVIQKATPGLSLDKIAKVIDDGNKNQQGYKLLKSSKKKLKGSEILNLEYVATKQGYDLKYKQHFIIKNGKVYNLTFTAKQKTYSKRVFKVIRMFNSLDID